MLPLSILRSSSVSLAPLAVANAARVAINQHCSKGAARDRKLDLLPASGELPAVDCAVLDASAC